MKKVKIVEIGEYNYILDDGNKKYEKSIEFNSKYKPKINDVIYISENVLEEENLFAFGDLYNDKKVCEDDIIKIVSGNNEYYLLRLYG